jgi:hypothetical protein
MVHFAAQILRRINLFVPILSTQKWLISARKSAHRYCMCLTQTNLLVPAGNCRSQTGSSTNCQRIGAARGVTLGKVNCLGNDCDQLHRIEGLSFRASPPAAAAWMILVACSVQAQEDRSVPEETAEPSSGSRGSERPPASSGNATSASFPKALMILARVAAPSSRVITLPRSKPYRLTNTSASSRVSLAGPGRSSFWFVANAYLPMPISNACLRGFRRPTTHCACSLKSAVSSW